MSIFLQRSPRQTQTINGSAPWGRFGSSVTCLGDVDLDGYKGMQNLNDILMLNIISFLPCYFLNFADIAIGATYANSGQGALYVYSGGPDGLLTNSPQTIVPQNTTRKLQSFGSSVTSTPNFTGNHLPGGPVFLGCLNHSVINYVIKRYYHIQNLGLFSFG